MAMFMPQMSGTLFRFSGHDLYGNAGYGAGRAVGVCVISLQSGLAPTTVRTDSSATHGRSEEPVTLGEILLDRLSDPQAEDKITLRGQHYRVLDVQPRFDLLGQLAHYQVRLGALHE